MVGSGAVLVCWALMSGKKAHEGVGVQVGPRPIPPPDLGQQKHDPVWAMSLLGRGWQWDNSKAVPNPGI